MKKIILLLMLGLLIFTACAKKEMPMNAETQALIKSEIEAKMNDLLSSAEQLKTDAMQKYLSDDADVLFYMGKNAFKKADLLPAILKEYELFSGQKLSIERQKYFILSNEAVMWKGELKSIATTKDGKTEESLLQETWLWQKQNGEWKVTHFDEYW